MMKEGDVILTPVPQADKTIKTRPAVILPEMPPYKDFLVWTGSFLIVLGKVEESNDEKDLQRQGFAGLPFGIGI